jgi:hypothetical protein
MARTRPREERVRPAGRDCGRMHAHADAGTRLERGTAAGF